MCPFYNAYLFEITGTTKGVFTHSQSSCHIAKVVLAFSHDSRQIPIASDAPPRHTSRGFLHWRLSDDGPGASRIVPDGRHPKPFTEADIGRVWKQTRNQKTGLTDVKFGQVPNRSRRPTRSNSPTIRSR